MTSGSGSPRRGCRVCHLDERVLVEVDRILASDPSGWSGLLFEGFQPPEGSLPRSWRQWGSVRMAQLWLSERGIDIRRPSLIAHFDRHLSAVVPSDSATILAAGRFSDGQPVPERPASLAAAQDYLTYFRRGLALGLRAMELMSVRIEQQVAKGEDPPANLLLELARLGRSLAASQAGIVSRGLLMAAQDSEDMDGFMEADGPRPSPRFGSYRVREIDGELRPVRDEGRADRQHHNARARQEGSTELPA